MPALPIHHRRAEHLSAISIPALGILSGLICLLVAMLSLTACGPDKATEPAHYEIVELTGTPYQRGYQHGRHFSNKIRSFYTQLLTASILPWLNRERPDLSMVLIEYQKPLYDNKQFSYQVMLQSGENLLKDIPEPYLEEMHGIADGADLPFEKILILNTFVDTLLGMRSVSFLIRMLLAPHLLKVEFLNAQDQIIETINPYEPSPYASAVELPVNVKVRFTLDDPEGIDLSSVRIQLNNKVLLAGHPSIRIQALNQKGSRIEVLFTPPGELPAASVVSLQIQANDLDLVTDPPPSHYRVMRDERIVFSTVGYGKEPQEIANKGMPDKRVQPSSLGFALRGSATADGRVLAAHHVALLDTNTSHKHTALFVHKPAQGNPHVVVGWVGLIWGFSGMNSQGLVHLTNLSDTQNNSLAGQLLGSLIIWGKLLASGVPAGIMGREMLTHCSTVEEASAYLSSQKSTFGWNILLADKNGTLESVELDSNIMNNADGGFHSYTPEDLDPWGRPWASVGPDDMRIDSHYWVNSDDINISFFGYSLLSPQRYVSTFYFRSLRPSYILAEHLQAAYGRLNVTQTIDILREPALIDSRDSMNAVIFQPEQLKLHFAMGQVPATSGSFHEFNLGAALR